MVCAVFLNDEQPEPTVAVKIPFNRVCYQNFSERQLTGLRILAGLCRLTWSPLLSPSLAQVKKPRRLHLTREDDNLWAALKFGIEPRIKFGSGGALVGFVTSRNNLAPPPLPLPCLPAPCGRLYFGRLLRQSVCTAASRQWPQHFLLTSHPAREPLPSETGGIEDERRTGRDRYRWKLSVYL